MPRLTRLLLPLMLSGVALATPAWVVPAATLYPVPNQTSAPLRSLPAGTRLDLRRCFALWCDVQQGPRRGWVLRTTVNVSGDCRQLVPLGLKGLRRTEAAYSGSRDLNHDGVACDTLDRPLMAR
ncbi:hypothetical protein [Deinococcus sedimenti]|nr:hypothetical protein [Deinococcus sedimenti]